MGRGSYDITGKWGMSMIVEAIEFIQLSLFWDESDSRCKHSSNAFVKDNPYLKNCFKTRNV